MAVIGDHVVVHTDVSVHTITLEDEFLRTLLVRIKVYSVTMLVLDKVKLLFCFTPMPADFTSVRYRYSCISTEASKIYIHIFVACIAFHCIKLC